MYCCSQKKRKKKKTVYTKFDTVEQTFIFIEHCTIGKHIPYNCFSLTQFDTDINLSQIHDMRIDNFRPLSKNSVMFEIKPVAYKSWF